MFPRHERAVIPLFIHDSYTSLYEKITHILTLTICLVSNKIL